MSNDTTDSTELTCPSEVTFQQGASRAAAVAFNICFIFYTAAYLWRVRLMRTEGKVYQTPNVWAWLFATALEGTLVGALFAEYASTFACLGGECFTPGCPGYNSRPTTWAVMWPLTVVTFVVLRFFFPNWIPGLVDYTWEEEITEKLGPRKTNASADPGTKVAMDSVPLLPLH